MKKFGLEIIEGFFGVKEQILEFDKILHCVLFRINSLYYKLDSLEGTN
jgi:hypothetical protein